MDDTVNLKPNKIDVSVSIGKSATALIPFLGGAIGEIIGNIIPNQRIDRITRFLESLDKKISELEKENLKSKITSPPYVDIMEDAFQQASRALTDERIEYISSLMKNGLTSKEVETIEFKKILWLLGELNDAEVIILKAYDHLRGDDDPFHEKHKNLIYGPQAYIGSTQKEVDKYSLHQTYRRHLESLGLLRPNFKRPRKGEFPEFDEKTGMIKANGYTLTNLGSILLRYIDLKANEE